MNEQLLDSPLEKHESLNIKWLVPFIGCLVVLIYLNRVIEFINPSGEPLFKTNLTSAIVNSGYLLGGLIFSLAARKTIVIYTGFILLIFFCISASVLVTNGLNLGWLDIALFGMGCGLVFFR